MRPQTGWGRCARRAADQRVHADWRLQVPAPVAPWLVSARLVQGLPTCLTKGLPARLVQHVPAALPGVPDAAARGALLLLLLLRERLSLLLRAELPGPAAGGLLLLLLLLRGPPLAQALPAAPPIAVPAALTRRGVRGRGRLQLRWCVRGWLHAVTQAIGFHQVRAQLGVAPGGVGGSGGVGGKTCSGACLGPAQVALGC